MKNVQTTPPLLRLFLPSIVALLAAHHASGAPIGTGVRSGNFAIGGYSNNFNPPFTSGTSAERTYSAGAEGNGSTSVTANFGLISANATFTTPLGNSDGNTVLTAGYFADTLLIDAPGLTGSNGTVEISFTIGGSLTSTGYQFNEAAVRYTFGTDAGDGIIPNNFSLSTNYVEAFQPEFINPGESGRFWEVPQSRTIGFTYGTPFDFYFVLEAYVDHLRDSSAVGTSTANVSLVDWSGFRNVKNSGGQPVNNATISAPASNYDWSQPIPEPGSATLLAFSVGLLGLRRRR